MSKYWRTHAQGQYDAITDGANVILAAKKIKSNTILIYLLLEVKTENYFNYKPLSAQFLFLPVFSLRFGGQSQQCGK